MAYTINQGYQQERSFDRVQRGLLIGLPAIALILSFGAIRHHNQGNSTAGQSAKLIPIVSSLSSGSKTDSNTGKNDNTGSSTKSGGGTSSTGTSGNVLGASTSSTSGGTGSTSGTPPLTGGMGGGPGGGSTTLPNCSIGQIATVNCQVPECTPTVDLSPGQKAILGVNGTCVIVN